MLATGLFSGEQGTGAKRAVHEVALRVSRHNRELLGLQRLGEIEIASNLLALDTFNRYLGTNIRTFTCDDAQFNVSPSISKPFWFFSISLSLSLSFIHSLMLINIFYCK